MLKVGCLKRLRVGATAKFVVRTFTGSSTCLMKIQNSSLGNAATTQKFRIDINKHYKLEDLERIQHKDTNDFVKLLKHTSLDKKSTIDKYGMSSLLTNDFIVSLRSVHISDVLFSIRNYGANCHSDQELCVKLISHLLTSRICLKITEEQLSSCVLSMSRLGLKWDMLPDEAQTVLMELIKSRKNQLNQRQSLCIEKALQTINDRSDANIIQPDTTVQQQTASGAKAVGIKSMLTVLSIRCSGVAADNDVGSIPHTADFVDVATSLSPQCNKPSPVESKPSAVAQALSGSRLSLHSLAATSGHNEQTVQFCDRLEKQAEKAMAVHKESQEKNRIKPRFIDIDEPLVVQPVDGVSIASSSSTRNSNIKSMSSQSSNGSLPMVSSLGRNKGSMGTFPALPMIAEQTNYPAVDTAVLPVTSSDTSSNITDIGAVVASPVELQQPQQLGAGKRTAVQFGQLSAEKQKEVLASVERLASTAASMSSEKYAVLLRRYDSLSI